MVALLPCVVSVIDQWAVVDCETNIDIELCAMAGDGWNDGWRQMEKSGKPNGKSLRQRKQKSKRQNQGKEYTGCNKCGWQKSWVYYSDDKPPGDCKFCQTPFQVWKPPAGQGGVQDSGSSTIGGAHCAATAKSAIIQLMGTIPEFMNQVGQMETMLNVDTPMVADPSATLSDKEKHKQHTAAVDKANNVVKRKEGDGWHCIGQEGI